MLSILFHKLLKHSLFTIKILGNKQKYAAKGQKQISNMQIKELFWSQLGKKHNSSQSIYIITDIPIGNWVLKKS